MTAPQSPPAPAPEREGLTQRLREDAAGWDVVMSDALSPRITATLEREAADRIDRLESELRKAYDRCAKVCDELADRNSNLRKRAACVECATRIRALSKPTQTGEK